jgi:hypothetical protein
MVVVSVLTTLSRRTMKLRAEGREDPVTISDGGPVKPKGVLPTT